MATAPMHRSVAFLRGLWAARPAGRLRLQPLLRQLVQVKQATTAAAPRLPSAAHSARLPRGPVQPHRHFATQSRLGAYGRSSLTRPAPGSFSRQEVGLGKARQFSSAPKAAEIMQNAPLLLRAALDSLDCPTKSIGKQAAVWPKVGINKDGRIALGPRAAIKESSAAAAATITSSPSSCAGTSDLFQTEALFDDVEAAMELLIPAQPTNMPSFPFELDTHDADRVLSPAFMHVLERQGSYMHQHFKRLQRLLKVLEEHGQLLSVQLISLKREESSPRGGAAAAAAREQQVFRVAIRSWSEAELRQALGLFAGDVPPWTDLVDWRKVHGDGDSTGLSSSTEQEMDFIFPQIGHSYETMTTTEDYDDCALSSTSGGRTMSSEGLGLGSFLRDLDELQSPRFGSSAALPV